MFERCARSGSVRRAPQWLQLEYSRTRALVQRRERFHLKLQGGGPPRIDALLHFPQLDHAGRVGVLPREPQQLQYRVVERKRLARVVPVRIELLDRYMEFR